jgi:hypothetical protein
VARLRRLTVLLRALLDTPELRLRLLVGEDALDRPVGGVYTTDLLDPRRYLSGGEIVLTGLVWRRTPADSEVFVATLVACAAVALAAGDAALGSVPDDLVAACRRHQLPLFEVPVDVSFAAITERVLTARLRASAEPSPAVARLRLLAGGPPEAARPGGAASPPAVFAAASRDYGVTGWVISAVGRPCFGAPPLLGEQLRYTLASAWLAASELPVTAWADGVPYSLFGVTGQQAHRLARWFVAFSGDHRAWDSDQRAIADELVRVAAGYRARYEEGQRGARRSADGALRQVLDWRLGADTQDEETAAALRRCGLAPYPPLVAVVLTAGPTQAGAPGQPPDLAGAPHVARVLLEDLLPAPVVGVSDTEAVALAPGGAEVVDRLGEAAVGLARVAELELAIGVAVLSRGRARGGRPGRWRRGQPRDRLDGRRDRRCGGAGTPGPAARGPARRGGAPGGRRPDRLDRAAALAAARGGQAGVPGQAA